MQYRKFEDVPVWIESKNFVNDIYRLIAKNPKLARDYSLADQLKRASYSLMLNIAEGFERGSNKEFANFLNIAKGSAGEVRSILYILKENNFIDDVEFSKFYANIEMISSHLSNFRKFLISHVTRKK